MKHLQIKLNQTEHTLLILAKALDPQQRTMAEWAKDAILEKLHSVGLNENNVPKQLATAAKE